MAGYSELTEKLDALSSGPRSHADVRTSVPLKYVLGVVVASLLGLDEKRGRITFV